MTSRTWGGRFEARLDKVAADFSASVDVDQRLGPEDIEGSIAHVNMLAAQGIVTKEDAGKITAGLQAIQRKIADGKCKWDRAHEDVHMNIEAQLTEAIGDAGGRLHTARSRNDQVATDLKLWTRKACAATVARIDRLSAVLVARAEATVDVLMPGYTHLQRAQPVRLAHHLLAWVEMLERDRGRLEDARARMNECPLGAGALATTTFPIDRQQTASALGFDRPTANSLDTVADRDFVTEAVSALAICAVHLSRIGEELVVWSSQEFGFVTMSDAFTTGSSMMPQKKNPDMAELVRGKAGRVIGSLVNLLVLQKGLPLSYNRDLQEDKTPLFDAFDTVDDSLDVLAGAIAGAQFHTDRMRSALVAGFVDATELADYLVAKGAPFRDAHHVAGRLVQQCIAARKTLSELSIAELQAADARFAEDVYAALQPETMVDRRDVWGGPARDQVARQMEIAKKRLEERKP